LMASTLTRREREVLELLAAGATSDQLAEELSLSPHTVRTHIQNIMSKLQVHSRLEAATFAVRNGIVFAGKDRLAG
jgi:two-component system nitrate/nitrite response regulator NarL